MMGIYSLQETMTALRFAASLQATPRIVSDVEVVNRRNVLAHHQQGYTARLGTTGPKKDFRDRTLSGPFNPPRLISLCCKMVSCICKPWLAIAAARAKGIGVIPILLNFQHRYNNSIGVSFDQGAKPVQFNQINHQSPRCC